MILTMIFTDIPILIVFVVFIVSIIYCIRNYLKTGKNLNILIKYFDKFRQNDLNFRLNEIDEWMSKNDYVASVWLEFRNTLVYSESIALTSNDDNVKYKEISSTVQNVQTTADPLYFFNEDNLVTSKFNYKMIQTIPTILTGFGPLFTFLNIALAFGRIDFSTQEKTIESISSFMSTMQVAALVSVIAVSSSLIYLLIERTMYNKLCKSPLTKIQEIMGRLFASISAEKFLYELLREAKLSGNSTANIIKQIPTDFKDAFNSGLTTNLIPYLENLLFGLNQLNKQLKESLKAQRVQDDVDELF